MTVALIPGGYILLARRLTDSGIMNKPSLFMKMWIWMLLQASFKDHGNLKRGQFFTSIDRMRESFSYKIGYRIIKPSIKEIRAAYDFLTKGTMIGITKVTHGMLITIINYELYQNFLNYEGHAEGHSESSTQGTILRKKGKERNIKTFLSDSIEIRLAALILEKIIFRLPGFKKPDLQKWAKDIDLMIRIDNRDTSEISQVIEWSQQDQFWQSNILSTSSLRKKFDRLKAKMQSTGALNERRKTEPEQALNCSRCGKRIIVKSDLTENGCVYCEVKNERTSAAI
jgi:hypothetical protein